MKKETKKARGKRRKRKRFSCICLICWTILPLTVIALLALDGCGVYTFNKERLLVIGACALVVLLPFFSEITVRSFSIKKENGSK